MPRPHIRGETACLGSCESPFGSRLGSLPRVPNCPLHLLHGELQRRLAVRKLHSDARALNFSHNVVQLLGFLQHLPITAAELAQHTVGHVRDAVGRVA